MPKERRKTNGTEAVQWGRRRTDRSGTDFKILFRKLEHALSRIEQIENIAGMLSHILEILVSEFRDELGFESGRLYERDGDDFVLCCAHGMDSDVPIGFRVTSDYRPSAGFSPRASSSTAPAIRTTILSSKGSWESPPRSPPSPWEKATPTPCPSRSAAGSMTNGTASTP